MHATLGRAANPRTGYSLYTGGKEDDAARPSAKGINGWLAMFFFTERSFYLSYDDGSSDTESDFENIGALSKIANQRT